ncbi:ESX secretion-associated protein EspG [Amycolatopsis sp. PS_44_ISF1]|uniref:ESX secretion-associated protein EspG n=1 Tax=Amycolatopsis sp. PS_44_ISF1 TaxID=2974917 RepID=UPI0028E044FE|nr:ESX secretion-associated protein EspG [Amycolatopsis sp. PS_44_ISF1]MDT8910266.1 ESX secretion-associated protein EspG [Amycolatopsis sp. PS_44_ISF1]
MSVLERAVVLPKLAFTTAWAMLDLGDPPPVLGPDIHYWMSDGVRRELHEQTIALLAEHGLARHDRLNPLWRATLRVISTPDREFYAWSGLRDGTQSASLIALRDEQGVCLRSSETTVEVRPVRVKWPATSLFDTLPDVPGASIRTVTLPRDPGDNLPDPLAEPADSRDRDHLAEVLSRPQDAVHQLYTARRDESGRRTRSLPITALDLTDQGRVLTYLTEDDRVTLVSGTPRTVVKTLNDTHDGLL